MLKPWREIAVPHKDVLEGRFLQSEFAADLKAVHNRSAPKEYQDPVAFFDRTFITAGMSALLVQVARRLSGDDGDPVIQLQTAFGGGKTHTMLAVYHLASRSCPLSDLAGVPSVLDQANIMEVPQAKVVVLDGTAFAPGQPWKHGKQTIKTLWGELAWQLGDAEGFAMVKEADASGTSPGKQVLGDMLKKYTPCVILMDELVNYFAQFANGQVLSGGTYESNLAFIQAITEAIKPVSGAILLASLPKSEHEVGGERGLAALKALESRFTRIQSVWRPVETDEAFEIVRRRLFAKIDNTAGRDAVCKAFAELYQSEGSKVPSETHEARYVDRLIQAYPVHPEVFERLYQDWTTIDGFQRTRGVLKLMAKVIHKLWKDNNTDLMIMPGSLPVGDNNTRSDLTCYLDHRGWDAVIERDIDGDRAETATLERNEPRFGQVQAARRVTRTLFLATAPSSVALRHGTRGVDRARVILGCVQPGQSSSVYGDALNRLADRCHYLNASGDKLLDTTRFWFDTKATLRREMEDRKGRFDDSAEVKPRIGESLKRLVSGATHFDGHHVFTPHGDVPDDHHLRLVVLTPEQSYTKDDQQALNDTISEYLRQNGAKPRYRANRLLFLVADRQVVNRLKDTARTALAWSAIVNDIKDSKLIVDQNQQKQAQKELQTIEEVVPRAARECYKWLICPVQSNPSDQTVTLETYPLNTAGGSLGAEIERVCQENELVITTWSPVHLRTRLKDLYWKADRPEVQAMQFWEDSTRYLYLPRLKERETLAAAIRTGSSAREFFGTALGKVDGKYEGFKIGEPIYQLDDTLLLIEPGAAAAYVVPKPPAVGPGPVGPGPGPVGPGPVGPGPVGPGPGPGPGPTPPGATFRHFHGSADIPAASAKMKMALLASEIIEALTLDPNAKVTITVEIQAEFPNGAAEGIRRAVNENAAGAGLKTKEWE